MDVCVHSQFSGTKETKTCDHLISSLKYQNSCKSKLRTTTKGRFSFTLFWQDFLFTSQGVRNVKIRPWETNTKPFVTSYSKQEWFYNWRPACMSLNSLEHFSWASPLFVYGLFFFFPLEGSRFLHYFKLRCLAIDLTVNHFTKYHFAKHRFAKYRFAKYRFAKYRFAKYRFAKYHFVSFRFAKYHKPSNYESFYTCELFTYNNDNCAVPENIHTPPTEGIGISWGVGGSVKPKNSKKYMKLNSGISRGVAGS